MTDVMNSADIQGFLEDDRFMARRVMFSDEGTFSSKGADSSRICKWWCDENPHFTIKTRDQYSFKPMCDVEFITMS